MTVEPYEEQIELQKIWSILCKHQIQDLDQNFFDVGGYSLLLIELIRHIEMQFSVTIKVMELFRHSSIRTQARLIRSKRSM